MAQSLVGQATRSMLSRLTSKTYTTGRTGDGGRGTGDGDTGDHRLVTRDLELACQ